MPNPLIDYKTGRVSTPSSGWSDYVVLNDTSEATRNLRVLQYALSAGENVEVRGDGIVYIDGKLSFTVGNTTLDLGAGVTLAAVSTYTGVLLEAVSLTNIGVTGAGVIQCASDTAPTFTSVTRLSVTVRCQTSAGAVVAILGSGNTSSAAAVAGSDRKVQVPGGIFCDWSAYNGTLAMVSTDANDDIALDTTVTLDGYPAAKCTFTTAASGTFIADYTFSNAISLKNFRTIQVPLKITGCDSGNTGGVGTGSAPFQLWLTLSGGNTIRLLCDFTNIPPNQWAVFSWSRSNSSTGMVTFAGGETWASLDSQTITKIRIVQATSAATSNNYPVWIGPMRCDARAQGHVSIVMDGAYISQYTILKPLLDIYGFKTSLAIVNSFIGSSASYMTLAQVDQMYDEGHECIHHTYDGTKTNGYLNATDWPAASDISADIKQGFDYFRSQGWTRGIGKAVNAYANPFASGQTAARHKLMFAAMQAAGVECSRASVPLYTQQPTLGYKGVKPFHLPGAIQITSSNTAADVQAVIDQAETNGEWAIITVHRAVASSPGSLEMTTANFTTWLAYLQTRVVAGGVTVAPLGDVYDKYFK